MPPLSFTAHAQEQITDRSQLSVNEIESIIKYELAVPIGTEGNKIHKLFWSQKDSAWFVAVQDWDDGTIITVLPKCRTAWRVSDDILALARDLALGRVRPI